MANILVIEDEILDQMILESLLTQLDHDPVFVGTAESALEIYDLQSFDVVMTDLVLPGMNGLRFIRQLRAQHPNVAIIAASGRRLDQLGPAREFGAAAVLTKPLNMNRLRGALDRVAPSSAGREQVPA